MVKNNRIFSLMVMIALCMLSTDFSFAQSAAGHTSDVRHIFESNGKMPVVILVISTIFVGIIAFLIFLERKMNKLEKIQKSKS